MNAPLPLSVNDLTVAWHRKPVIWDVDLEVQPGQLVGVVGPNGAGKSTLLKAIMDLVPKASGRVEIFGQSYRQSRHRVGYVPQRESVDWDFPISVLDVVTMGLYGKIGWCMPVRSKHRWKKWRTRQFSVSCGPSPPPCRGLHSCRAANPLNSLRPV